MKKIIQLSDLHFGRTDATVLEKLREAVRDLQPDLLVVSGDLTQRAKVKEFLAAREFLASLPKPQLVVPGNHDISFYNVWRRFVNPLKRFKEYISAEEQPVYISSEAVVIGLNTARSLVFKGGRVSYSQIQQVENAIAGADEQSKNALKILVSHHPLNHVRAWRHLFFGYSEQALSRLVYSGVDVFLSGHLHKSEVVSFVKKVKERTRVALLIRAGTASSNRYRGEVNSFNVLSVDGVKLKISTYLWNPSVKNFVIATEANYVRSQDEWIAQPTS